MATLALASLGAMLSEGSYTLAGRNFVVASIPQTTPAPVLICLHGNGGDGGMAQAVKNGNPSIAATHIIVGPDGPERSWNIKAEASQEDDQAYVGETLVNHLATFDNIEPKFRLYGFSNGAALTNRIFIENDDARIDYGITDAAARWRPGWADPGRGRRQRHL